MQSLHYGPQNAGGEVSQFCVVLVFVWVLNLIGNLVN